MEITTGKIAHAVKACIYGVHGIGKTTFASKWPRPLFLDVERGSLDLDVARITPQTYSEVQAIVSSLMHNTQGYQTLAIDTTDWLEGMMTDHICKAGNVRSIGDFGYGKGWAILVEEWQHLLDALDRLRDKTGMHILLLAHSRIRHIAPPDEREYDRYTLVNNEKSADVICKWVDLLLFCKFDTYTVEDDKNKVKVQGSGKRLMFSSFHPCWDAKTRYQLPSKMPMEISAISSIFPASPVSEPANKETEPVKQTKISEQPASQNAGYGHKYDSNDIPSQNTSDTSNSSQNVQSSKPEPSLAASTKITQIERLVSTEGYRMSELQAVIEGKGIVPAGTPIASYNLATLDRIITGWTAVAKNIKLKRSSK